MSVANLGPSQNNATKEHWEQVYQSKCVTELGWYEERPAPSLQLIEASGVSKEGLILDVGAGASSLLRHLCQRGYQQLAALDVSASALAAQRAFFPLDGPCSVRWIVGDVTEPRTLAGLPPVALWHDRAALHFLVDDAARARYHRALECSVPPGGHAVIATFAASGATHCSNLPVRRYDPAALSDFMGPAWEPLRLHDHLYYNPRGEPRPYLYALFRRQG